MLATTRQRVAVLAAGLLIVLALGLPWTTSTEFSTGGWFVGSMCTPNSYDGTIWCTGSYYSPGLTGGTEALSGNGTVARVFLVGALVLMILAWVRGHSRLLVVAGAALLVGILLAGLTLLGGQVATMVAAALLLYAGLNGGGAPARV